MTQGSDETSQQRVTEPGQVAALPRERPAAPLTRVAVEHETLPDGIMPPAPGELEAAERLDETRWKYAEAVHKYIREYIALADQKAAFFFAVAAALLALLDNEGQVSRWMKDWVQWSFLDALSLVAVVGLTVSAIICVGTILPRRRGSRRGIVFFGAIVEFETPQAYANEILKKEPCELVYAKLQHVRELSAVCTRKYDFLRAAIWSGSVGAGAALLLLILTR